MAINRLEKLQELRALRMRKALLKVAQAQHSKNAARAKVISAQNRKNRLSEAVAERNKQVFEEVKDIKDPSVLFAQITSIRHRGRLKIQGATEDVDAKEGAEQIAQSHLFDAKATHILATRNHEKLSDVTLSLRSEHAAQEELEQEEDVSDVSAAQFFRRHQNA